MNLTFILVTDVASTTTVTRKVNTHMPHEKENIADHVLSFQRGEEKGFTYFFQAFYSVMYYYAFRITRDNVKAQEIAEDAFIRLWEKHASFNHHKQIKSWLYSAISTACIEWLRKQKSPIQHKELIASVLEHDYEEKAAQELIRAEVTREIYTAIQNLPPRCQEVFKLIYIEGKTLKEAAELMQLSVYTIKNHRARGLALLKRKIPDLVLN